MARTEARIYCTAWNPDGCILDEGYCLKNGEVCHGGMSEDRSVAKNQIVVGPCGAAVVEDTTIFSEKENSDSK